MRSLNIDIETYSSEDLLSAGLYKYVEAPDFEVLLFGYSIDGDPVQVLDLTEESTRQSGLWRLLCRYLTDPGVLKIAANAAFERICLGKYLGVELPREQWDCTLVRAARLGLPSSLDGLAKAVGLPEEQQKLKTGKALIQYFSKPCKPTARNGGRTRNLPHHDPEKWALYKQYNAGDVVAEMAARAKIERYPVPEEERALWLLDQKINDRGVLTDAVLVREAIAASDEQTAGAIEEAAALTGLANPKSGQQLKAWLQEADPSLDVDSLTKETVPQLMKATTNPEVRRALQLRQELSKASVKKYEAIARAVNADGRLRGTMKFYGARTGRWAGRIFQPQNLPQNTLVDLDLARELVCAGDIESVALLFGDVPGTLSQLVRTALIPKPGCSFLVADYSAIEARVIAWYAREEWRMNVFNTHGKIYEASAEQMFHLPDGSIDKHTPEGAALRKKGKVAELALGYGGGPPALVAMGALKQGLDEDELPGLVSAWRAASPKIVQFWWSVGDAAIEAVATGLAQKTHGLIFDARDGFLFIQLPSGRRLAYPNARLERGQRGRGYQLIYDGTDQNRRVFGRLDTYGPRLVENIVQATARDLLAHGMLALDAAGFEICFHVHDEVIIEDKADALDAAVALLTKKPAWSTDLPLDADGFTCSFYRKD